MLFRLIAISLLVIVQLPNPSVVMAEGDVAAFKAAYGSYQTALEANDTDAASDAAGRALELGRDIYPGDSPSVLALHVNYGDMLIEQQRYDEAIALLQEAVTSFGKHYGKKDPRLIYALWSLAEANGRVGEHDIAVKQWTRLSGMVKKANGADSRIFGDVQHLLGQQSYFSPNHYKKARRALADAHEIYTALYGNSVFKTGFIALWLGKAEFLEERRRDGAELHFLEALEIFEATTPPGHQLRVVARDLLVKTYEATGRSQMATEYLVAIAHLAPRTEIDGELPSYKKRAAYPKTAARSERESSVLLEFTVTADGRVVDPIIVESDGGEDFERAALDAIRAYRYAPAVQDGQVIATDGVRSRVTFNLADLSSPGDVDMSRRQLANMPSSTY